VFVYVLRGGGFIKFGISKQLSRRHKALSQGALPFPVDLVGYAVLPDEIAKMLERALLNWDMDHANGEWFHDDGRSAESILEYIRKLVGPDLAENVYSDSNPDRHEVRFSRATVDAVMVERKWAEKLQ
jgi:hypothetical protein